VKRWNTDRGAAGKRGRKCPTLTRSYHYDIISQSHQRSTAVMIREKVIRPIPGLGMLLA
jgi:hypothetical protein